MYCGKCGTKFGRGLKFCTQCGASINEAKATAPAVDLPPSQNSSEPKPDVPVGTGTSESASRGSQGTPKSTERAEQNRVIGLVGAGIIAISLFMPFVTGSAGILGFSASKSLSFIGLMKNIHNGYATIISVFLFIGLVAVCHILKHPKISLIWVVILFLTLGAIVTEIGNWSFDIGIASVQVGIGMWVYLIGLFVCLVAALRKKS